MRNLRPLAWIQVAFGASILVGVSQASSGLSPLTACREAVVIDVLETAPRTCPGGMSPLCTVPVSVRVSAVLLDRDHLGLAPLEMRVGLLQWVADATDRPAYLWTGRTASSGERYIVGSVASRDLMSVIADPYLLEPIKPPADAVADAELIIGAEALSLPEQVQAAASAITSAGTRSNLLAGYAAALLQTGTDQEIAPLVDALDAAPAARFSEDARINLIYRLTSTAAVATDGVLRAFLTLTMRYFAEAEAVQPTLGRSPVAPVQVLILSNALPALRHSERAMTLFKAASRSPLGDQVRSTVLKLLADPATPEALRPQLRDFSSMLAE